MNNTQLINQDSGDYEYYTPIEIIEAAREVMGSIDLDPASSEGVNRGVNAEKFISPHMEFKTTKYHDLPFLTSLIGGLDYDWTGNVWLNHPFSRAESPCKQGCDKKICRKRGYHTAIKIPGNKEWVEYLVLEYKQGRLKQSCNISYASTSEGWFQPLHDYYQCYPFKRVNYYLPDGTKKKGVTKGSVITYLGDNTEKFTEVFKMIGHIRPGSV